MDLGVLGVTLQRLLREDQLAVGDDLEDAPAGGDEGQFLDVVGEVRQELGRQTDGSIRVVSNDAVFDADLHGSPPGALG